MFHKRFPKWQPSDDLPDLWFDATNTSTSSLKDTTGAAITNGATIGHWISQGGSAFDLQLFGANTRPTWASSGINGLAAVRCNSQILATTGTGGYSSMSAMTVLVVLTKVAMISGTEDCAVGFTESHDSGAANSSLVLMASADTRRCGGRRVQGNAFQEVLGDAVSNNVPHIQTGVFDWSNALLSMHQNGKQRTMGSTFQTAGTTSAAAPFAFAVGGFAQETGSALGLPANCFIGEILAWKNRAFTPSQLVGPHAYLARKWNPTGAAQF